MKLSEINTDKLCDILCEITEPISNIMADTELLKVLKDTMGLDKNSSKAEQLLVGAKKIGLLAPIVLKTHRADVYKILSIINEKTVEDIANQSGMITLREIKEAIADKELMSFFQ